jgi:hypothetical protein
MRYGGCLIRSRSYLSFTWIYPRFFCGFLLFVLGSTYKITVQYKILIYSPVKTPRSHVKINLLLINCCTLYITLKHKFMYRFLHSSKVITITISFYHSCTSSAILWLSWWNNGLFSASISQHVNIMSYLCKMKCENGLKSSTYICISKLNKH